MQVIYLLDSAEGVANDLVQPGTKDLKDNAIWIEHCEVTVARMRHGTQSGASAVMLRFDFTNDAGEPCTVMTQMTMANFLNSAAAMKGFEDRDAALTLPPAGRVQ